MWVSERRYTAAMIQKHSPFMIDFDALIFNTRLGAHTFTVHEGPRHTCQGPRGLFATRKKMHLLMMILITESVPLLEIVATF